MKPQPMIFHYRGGVERGARYSWRGGYSFTTPEGAIEYPWMTRGECRRIAKKMQLKAVFYRDGKEEAR